MASGEILVFTKYLQNKIANHLNTADLRVGVVSVTPTQSTDEFWSDISSYEVSTGSSYSAANGGSGYQLSSTTGTITAASKAASCVLTITSNPFVTGDLISISSVVGMTELNGLCFEVTAYTSTTATIDVDSTGFTTYTSGGTAESRCKRDGVEIVFNSIVASWAYDATGFTNGNSAPIFEYNASASAAQLVCFFQFASTMSLQSSGGAYISWPGSGIARFNPS